MRSLALALLLALPACVERPHRGPAYLWPPPRALATSPAGVPVHVPGWLFPAARDEAFAEIDAAGVPAGWAVEIVPPYFEMEQFDGTVRLTQGATLFAERRILVGFRPCETGPALPALEHEVLHAQTGDPCAGHPEPCS